MSDQLRNGESGIRAKSSAGSALSLRDHLVGPEAGFSHEYRVVGPPEEQERQAVVQTPYDAENESGQIVLHLAELVPPIIYIRDRPDSKTVPVSHEAVIRTGGLSSILPAIEAEESFDDPLADDIE